MKSDLNNLMQENNLDALWVMGPGKNNPAMEYLTGGVALLQADLFKKKGETAQLFHSPMERDEAAISGLETVSYSQYIGRKDFLEFKGNRLEKQTQLYAMILEDLQLTNSRIGIFGKVDIEKIYGILRGLESKFSEIYFESLPTVDVIQTARMTKDEEEINRIKQLGVLTAEICGLLTEFLTSHAVSENRLVKEDGSPLTIADAKNKVHLWSAERGKEVSGDLILSIGRDAGVPHSTGKADDVFELGKTIVFDFVLGELNGGYKHDFTRTWCLGYAPKETQEMYNQVLDIQVKIIQALQTGTVFDVFHEMACDYFEEMGHKTIRSQRAAEEGYCHYLGHGIGLQVHEFPVCSPFSKDKLLPGSVFTIEPGLYYPGKGFGIRIEDTICLEQDGSFTVLNEFPKELVLRTRN